MKKERVYHSDKKIDDSYFKYLQGVDVCRYVLNWSGEYLKYGKNLAAPRKFELFSTPRILVRQIPSKPPYCIHAVFVDETILNDRNSMNIIQIQVDPLYLLALLNSRLISFWFEHKFGKLSRGLFPQFKINELEIFPIPSATKEQQEKLARLADAMMDAKKQLAGFKGSAADRQMLEQRVQLIDSQINAQVYALYGLAPADIAVIGEKTI